MEFRFPINSRGRDQDADDPLYSLFVVVVHVGRTANYKIKIPLSRSQIYHIDMPIIL